MKNFLVLVMMAFLTVAVSTAHAEGDTQEGPSIDLVAMFGNTPDVVMNGVRLTSVMNVKYGRGQIRDVYNSIYYNGIEPNQIVCRTSWYADENNSNKIVPMVMWSVWYRPSAMVSKIGTECVDTKVDKKFLDTWAKKGYRVLGSGVEPHMHLQWLNAWVQTQRAIIPSYTWCKAAGFSYVKWSAGEWTKVHSKAVFDYNSAIMASALISRDVTCTSDASLYGKWVRTPGWSYILINP